MKNITLACGASSDGWKSSDLYLKNLAAALRLESTSNFNYSEWRGTNSGPTMLRRRLLFPIELAKLGNEPLHLLDQSYGDALLSYKGPSIVTVADIAFWRARGKNPLRKIIRKRISKGIASASAIISISQSTANELENELGISRTKIRVVPFAINSIFFSNSSPLPQNILGQSQGQPYLLHVGTLDPRKGFIRFVHAYALDPSFPILLQVGSSPSAEIKNTLFQLGLEKKVHFLGQQKIETLHSLYENCEALVFPSEYEGYGIPPVEARAAGARIITTPMPSVVEALGEVPRLSTNGDDHDWKSSIRVALNEPKPNRLNQSAQNQLSWSRVAIQTASIYNEIF